MFSSVPFAQTILGVALLGGIGSVIRLLLSHWHRRLPWGILVGNTLASLVVGLSYSLTLIDSTHWSVWAVLLSTGFAGGLSTFSSWAAQTTHLYFESHRARAALNALLNLTLPTVAASCGMILGPILLK